MAVGTRSVESLLAVLATTATPSGGTTGVSSQWTFGSMLVWAGVVAVVLYVLYRRFGYRPP